MSGPAAIRERAGFPPHDANRWLQRAAGAAVLVAEICLVAVLAFLLARLAWIAVEPGGAVIGKQPVPRTFQRTADRTGLALSGDRSLLVSEDPFGQGGAVEEVAIAAPETKLNLVLKGVRASEDGMGVAMIVMPDNRLQMFAPGEKILDGVVLERVYGDRVMLRKDGRIEALLMASGADRLSVLSTPDAGGAAAAKESGGATISTTAGDFLANLVINPVHRGQDFVGYEIGSRADAALLERSGLRAGDIILAVNGTPVATTAPGDLAMRLASSRSVRLRIDRDGRQIDQTFTLPENP